MIQEGYNILNEMSKAAKKSEDSYTDLIARMSGLTNSTVLDSLETVKKKEMVNTVLTIPVYENTRVGKCLVDISDLTDYMKDCDITRFDTAIKNVADANDIQDPNSIAIVIDKSACKKAANDAKAAAKSGNREYANAKLEAVENIYAAINVIQSQGIECFAKE